MERDYKNSVEINELEPKERDSESMKQDIDSLEKETKSTNL
jgi:hypothetical protein